jgi:hypothetical protein
MKYPDVNMRKAQAIEYYLHLADAMEHMAKAMRTTVEESDPLLRSYLVQRSRTIANCIDKMGGAAKWYMDGIEKQERIIAMKSELEGLQNEKIR